MNRIKIPKGATTITLAFNGEMTKMNDEQREAMASLNDEAKAALALSRAREEKPMTTTPKEIGIDTPMKEARGEEIAVPEPTIERELEETAAVGITRVVEHIHHSKGPQVRDTLRYTQDTLADEFARIFKDEIMALRNAGQKEYAHDDASPFANFERGADDMGIDRKQVLWAYAMKHKDGIAAVLKGHVSQREDVRGRINDLIVYLLLMRGMFNEEAGNTGNFGLGELEK